VGGVTKLSGIFRYSSKSLLLSKSDHDADKQQALYCFDFDALSAYDFHRTTNQTNLTPLHHCTNVAVLCD
jgi:hypothetical protein